MSKINNITYNIAKNIICFLVVMTFSHKSFGRLTDDIRGTTIPNLNLEEADVKDALSLLFKTVGVPYSVDSNVQGLVTIKVENQPFELVLRSMLNQVAATYKMADGNYEIGLRKLDFPSSSPGVSNKPESSDSPGGKVDPVIRRIKIDFADPQLVWTLLNRTNADFNLRPETTLLIQEGGNQGGGFRSGLGGSLGAKPGYSSLFNK